MAYANGLKRMLAAMGGIVLLTLLAFLPAIHYSLVYDDLVLIVQNPRLTAWSYVPGYFTTHFVAHSPLYAPRYYRPVSLIWLRLVYATLGAPSEIWHLSSILAHLAATACVFLLIHRLLRDFRGAALAAALFAIYPTQTETVAWVSCSGDLLLTGFLVLSVYFYAGRKGPISWPSIVFAALAMFTKEAGIVAPALILAYEWTQSHFKNAFTAAAPYSVAALLYIAFRANALGSAVSGAAPNMSVLAMVLTWPRLLAVYAHHLVWPVHLSPCYNVPVETAFWPLLLLIAVMSGLVWLLRGSGATVRFGAAWFAITLIPALAIRYLTRNDYVHDRYLYLPSVGLALIAAVGFSRIRFTRPRAFAACALALVLCWGTRLNLRIWQNSLSLFSRAAETAPNNPAVRCSLAEAYLDAHRASEALPLLQRLIEQYPDSRPVNYSLSHYYRQIGDFEAADHYMAISKQLNMRDPWKQTITDEQEEQKEK